MRDLIHSDIEGRIPSARLIALHEHALNVAKRGDGDCAASLFACSAMHLALLAAKYLLQSRNRNVRPTQVGARWITRGNHGEV